jgi:hypothetical protein
VIDSVDGLEPRATLTLTLNQFFVVIGFSEHE